MQHAINNPAKWRLNSPYLDLINSCTYMLGKGCNIHWTGHRSCPTATLRLDAEKKKNVFPSLNRSSGPQLTQYKGLSNCDAVNMVVQAVRPTLVQRLCRLTQHHSRKEHPAPQTAPLWHTKCVISIPANSNTFIAHRAIKQYRVIEKDGRDLKPL